MVMTKRKFTAAIDLLLPSIQIIKQNILTYFVLMVVPFLLITYGMRDAVYVRDLFSPLVLTGLGLTLVFYAPLIYTQTNTAKGKEISLQEAFREGYTYFWRLIGLNIVFSFALIGGLLLLIIPGIIMLRRYYLSFYYIVDRKLGIREAMEQSARESKKSPGAVYGVIGIILLFTLFGMFSTVGAAISAILTMLYGVAPALRYHEFKKLPAQS